MSYRRELTDAERAHLRLLAGLATAATDHPGDVWVTATAAVVRAALLHGVSLQAVASAAGVAEELLQTWLARPTASSGKRAPPSAPTTEPNPQPWSWQADGGRPFDTRTASEAPVYRTLVLALGGAATSGGTRHDLLMTELRRIFDRDGVVQELAGIRLAEIAAKLEQYRPRILHLVAHSDEQGVWLVDRAASQPVGWDAVIEQIGRAQPPETTLLSSCHSMEVAEGMARRFSSRALGCEGAVRGEDERQFVVDLYERWCARSLTVGRLRGAFDDACGAEGDRHPTKGWTHHLFGA